MPGPSYRHLYEQRVKDGVAKQAPKTSMTIDGNVVDLTEDHPKVTPAPRSPIPQDDPYHKERTETT
jgi:hypothetical protein